MTRTIEFSLNEYYHLFNRGVEKRKIFTDSHEYRRFQLLLFVCNSREKVDLGDLFRQGLTLSQVWNLDKKQDLVSIGSYCLMPNHFHILVREKTEGGISLFMQKLQTAYTMYFNKKHERSGALFQGTFKAQHLNEDNYLKYIFAYINLNPIKLIDATWKNRGIKNLSKSKKYLKSYQNSSYPDLTGEKRVEGCVLDLTAFPNYFFTSLDFKDFVHDWLDFSKENQKTRLNLVT